MSGAGTLSGRVKARRAGALQGVVHAPGDKSISHRALILGAMAEGISHVDSLLEGDDVLRTAAAMRALGVEIERENGRWRIAGAAWRQPEKSLYFGNSGTGARLVMGAVAGKQIAATFDGDASLRARPMGRVLEPLRMMGLEASDMDGRLPVEFIGGERLTAVDCKLAKPSAQVKSAILLAALGAQGTTRLHEPVLSRDHTERMLSAFGVKLKVEADDAVGRFIEIAGGQKLKACNISVPGDPSSAAFLTAAALITPGSDIVIENVLVNPLRAGFYETLKEMGANILFENKREAGGEPIADIRARHSVLSGVEVPADRAPSMVDEYPILAIVAAYAHGETKMTGLEELRIKESDRISAIEKGLAACGVDVRSGEDWLAVRGAASVRGGAKVSTHSDHRIAMSFLVCGLNSEEPVEIDDASMIATSFPGFVDVMRSLGGDLEIP